MKRKPAVDKKVKKPAKKTVGLPAGNKVLCLRTVDKRRIRKQPVFTDKGPPGTADKRPPATMVKRPPGTTDKRPPGTAE